MKQGIKRFFAYARARHQITLNRAAGLPREQWTRDPILQKYRFTCVFRELDKTTAWFREHVRDPLRDKPEVLLATVLFRLLNRIEVGRAVFLDDDLLDNSSAFYELVRACDGGKVRDIKRAIHGIEHAIYKRVGTRGPFVTGAYIITSPQGMKKLPGVLSIGERFCLESREWEGLGAGIYDTMGWSGEEGAANLLLMGRGEYQLQEMWQWLKKYDYFGPFHSYEMVTDLRHTALLDRAPDIMTWANPGPGCRRGLNRMHGRDKDLATPRNQLIQELQELVHLANTDSNCWPKDWPRWEMRDAEHTSCEGDKNERVRLGEGTPRGVYR